MIRVRVNAIGAVWAALLLAAAAAAVVVAGVAVAAVVSPGTPSLANCTDKSTACLDAVAMSYLNAIASKSPGAAEAVRAAPNVQRWEDGLHNVTSRAQLVTELQNTEKFAVDLRDVRLYVGRGGDNVFAMYLVDGGAGTAALLTSHVIERIGISHGLITQVEIVQCAGGPGEQARGTATDITGTLDIALCLRVNPAIPAGLAHDR